MEEEKKLYPFRLVPVEDNPDETYGLADLGFPDSLVRNGYLATNSLSEIMEMYMDRVVGEGVYSYYGRQFPVLLKTLKGTSRTPLTVHPDDVTAAERFDFLGKGKLWYVVSCVPGSRLYLGLRNDVASSDFYHACKDGTVEELLNVVKPQPGDYYYIAPGTVHAASEGVVIVEIAESSPLDFHIYDWGRKKGEVDPFDAELTLEAAFDFIDYSAFADRTPHFPEDASGVLKMTDCEEFEVSSVRLASPLHITAGQDGSFAVYHCLSGTAVIEVPKDPEGDARDSESYPVGPGETVLVPAEVQDFYLVPRAEGTCLLEVVCNRKAEDGQMSAADGKLLN